MCISIVGQPLFWSWLVVWNWPSWAKLEHFKPENVKIPPIFQCLEVISWKCDRKFPDILSQIARPVTQTSALLDCKGANLCLFSDEIQRQVLVEIFMIFTNVHHHDKEAVSVVVGWKDFCHLGLWFAASVLLTRSHYSRLKQEDQKQNTHDCF